MYKKLSFVARRMLNNAITTPKPNVVLWLDPNANDFLEVSSVAWKNDYILKRCTSVHAFWEHTRNLQPEQLAGFISVQLLPHLTPKDTYALEQMLTNTAIDSLNENYLTMHIAVEYLRNQWGLHKLPWLLYVVDTGIANIYLNNFLPKPSPRPMIISKYQREAEKFLQQWFASLKNNPPT